MSVRPTTPDVARVTCREFRRKTDYYVNEAEGRPDHEACPEYPWCGRTLRVVGPDDGPVLIERCRPGRSCFVPLLGPEAT
jgi:hypothetical protein